MGNETAIGYGRCAHTRRSRPCHSALHHSMFAFSHLLNTAVVLFPSFCFRLSLISLQLSHGDLDSAGGWGSINIRYLLTVGNPTTRLKFRHCRTKRGCGSRVSRFQGSVRAHVAFIARFWAGCGVLCDAGTLRRVLPAPCSTVALSIVIFLTVSAGGEPGASISAVHCRFSSCSCDCSDSPPTSKSSLRSTQSRLVSYCA